MNLNSIKRALLAAFIPVILTACGADTTAPLNDSNPVKSTVSESINNNATDADTTNVEISLFFKQWFDREVAQDPEYQSALGLKTEDQDKWFDRSDAASLANIEEAKEDLLHLRSFDRALLSNANSTSYELLEYQLQETIDAAPFLRHPYVVDQFRGQVTDRLSLLLNAHSITSLKDAEDYIARIKGLGGVYKEMTTQLVDRAVFGVLTPAFAYPDMIADISGLGSGMPIDDSGEPHILLNDFTKKIKALELDKQATADFIARTSAAISGPFKSNLEALLIEIKRQSKLVDGNKGVWSLPDGEAFYNAQIKQYTTLNLTADEVHQRGLDDIARIHTEMRGIMQTLEFEGSLQDFFVFARTDPSNFYSNDDVGREAFLTDARQQTADIFAVADQYFNRLPKATMEVRRVEPWRENSTSIAFYESPPLDGSRPGYYYANLKDMSTYQKSVSTAITYHEGVPGHHFQIALAQELKDLPDFRKHSFYGAYTEGWALYAEGLAKDMGFYQQPMSDFGRLHDEIWRSARLVIDTGIHSKKWTREQAIDYFRQNTPLSEGDMVTEVERFFVWPGQALGYKIGMMKILELRARAEEKLGELYDIREFHDVVIGKGAMPLPILEAEVDAYINAKQLPN
ncbi:MAG: hypothetical protein ACJA2E_001790 [Arenicella sp.]|jgi:uncharacterized protein (DUF885 family)